VFGYGNVDVLGPDGNRSHVERRINEREASSVGCKPCGWIVVL
jgi:hypothetical protein